jgi:hypothetical protein
VGNTTGPAWGILLAPGWGILVTLDNLAKGDQPIILALPRGLKKRWEPEIQAQLKTDRFLIITPFDNSVTRITKEAAEIRNRLMLELADDIVVGYLDQKGSLDSLLSELNLKNKIHFLTE